MVSPSGMILKNMHVGFPQLTDQLVFAGMSAAQYLPPGGRGTAKRWMRNGDISSFGMQPNQTVQTFPMYLFNEMHTNMEHIAVPHPPQCALLKHLPPGGRYGAADIPTNSNLSGCWGKTIYTFLNSSPEGIPHLISDISYLPCGGIF